MGKFTDKQKPSFISDLVENKPTHTHEYKHTPTPVVKEIKDKRVNLLMKPSVVNKLDVYAKSKGTSRNDILDKLVEEFFKDEDYRTRFEEKYFVEE